MIEQRQRDDDARGIVSDRGVISYLHPIRQFGRIYVPGEGRIFFDSSDLVGVGFFDLATGMRVRFRVASDRRGRLSARHVEVITS